MKFAYNRLAVSEEKLFESVDGEGEELYKHFASVRILI